MDGGIVADAVLRRPDRYAFFQNQDNVSAVIPRGAGFSFAAASFGADAVVLDLSAFDRVLDFDSATGLVEVEAGITLGALFRFLTARGYYLPVQPGHPSITVGGCIAADIHGKNPARDGTFIGQIETLRLFHPRHGVVTASEREEPALFRATCGGFGLTGIVIAATLRARRLPGTLLNVARHPVADGAAGAALLRQSSGGEDLVYGWLDLSRATGFGGGYVVSASFAGSGTETNRRALPRSRFSAASRARQPWPLLNRHTIRLVNWVYGRKLAHSGDTMSLWDALYPRGPSEIFLWLYGRAGFHEYQALIPERDYRDYLDLLRAESARLDVALCLGVAKPFAGASDLLRFAGEGVSLAVHVPRGDNSAAFLAALDRFVVARGGKPNLIKDSRLPRAVVDAAYPEADRFRAFRRDWDPNQHFRSELSLRLGL